MLRTSIAAIAIFVLSGCSIEELPVAPRSGAPVKAPAKVAVRHLPNTVWVHERVISGGLPEGDAAFAELRSLGVKTIISVDGAQPDVEAARKFALRYVHLPHGYDGIPDQRALELAKAVRDVPGVVYIHCHHGRHRSPAAAAVACVGAGLIHGDAALGVLEAAGTSPNYRGLFQSVQQARRLDRRRLDGLQADFPERAKIPALAEAMVALEHTHDHLKELATNGWQPLAAKPDLDAAHESLLLREHLTELLRTDDTRQRPDRFQELLGDGEAAARDLERALASRGPERPELARQSLDRITANCAACHQHFRDVPLSEK